MSYQPRDIQTLEEVARTVGYYQYLDTLGMAEYEFIAGKIIEESQQAGSWTAVGRPLLGSDFSHDYEDSILEEMVQGEFLIKKGDQFMLTDLVIERIAKKYPSSHQRQLHLFA